MKICIDGFPFLQQGGGINRYSRYLLQAMLEEDAHNKFILFLNTWRKAFLQNIHSVQSIRNGSTLNYKLVKIPRKILNALWLNFSMVPVERFVGEFDVYHSLHCVLPSHEKGALVLTIHDVAYHKHPEFYQNKKLGEYDMNFLLKKSAPRASRIIVISQNTKQDVQDILKIPEEKIRVIYYGIDHARYKKASAETTETALKKLGINLPYILAVVGTLEPRKNIFGLLRAFSQLKKRSRIPHALVISGGGPPSSVAFYEHHARVFRVDRDVVFACNLTENDILSLYSGADFFVYPSFYEGFGLPVLEAMCFGLPVACSNVTSLPEVAGDAGNYFNPQDVEEMTYVLLSLAESNTLRKRSSEKSVQRAEMFSWEKAARETLDVYKEAIACG